LRACVAPVRQLRPRGGGNKVPVGEQIVAPAQNVERVNQCPAVRPRANRRRAPVEQEPVSEQNVQMEADQVVDPPPPKQMRTTSVQASNGEDIIDNYLNIANPILMPCSNETDILVSQQTKDKIWNFEYTDFAQLIKQNGQYYNNIEQKQNIILENGKLVISNRSSKLKSVDNIDLWTQSFTNFSKILIQKHPLLASDLLTYMSIIRGAVADTPFERIYQYDRQFRLCLAQNHIKSWAQMDGFLWLQFIAKGAQGVSNAVVHDNLTKL
jgi:hypothetical protein